MMSGTGGTMPREKGAPPQITPKSLDDYLDR